MHHTRCEGRKGLVFFFQVLKKGNPLFIIPDWIHKMHLLNYSSTKLELLKVGGSHRMS